MARTMRRPPAIVRTAVLATLVVTLVSGVTGQELAKTAAAAGADARILKARNDKAVQNSVNLLRSGSRSLWSEGERASGKR